MRRFFLASVALLLLGTGLHGQSAPDGETLTALLKDFLAGASRNELAAHERFWADDLIYTSSSGKRFGKAEILKDARSSPPAKPDEPASIYSAEDIRIHQYGDVAVVAFRLVGVSEGKTQRYLNSGTFLKRDGEWRVVCWQATKMEPDSQD